MNGHRNTDRAIRGAGAGVAAQVEGEPTRGCVSVRLDNPGSMPEGR